MGRGSCWCQKGFRILKKSARIKEEVFKEKQLLVGSSYSHEHEMVADQPPYHICQGVTAIVILETFENRPRFKLIFLVLPSLLRSCMIFFMTFFPSSEPQKT